MASREDEKCLADLTVSLPTLSVAELGSSLQTVHIRDMAAPGNLALVRIGSQSEMSKGEKHRRTEERLEEREISEK